MSKEGRWDVRPFIYATFYGKCQPHGGKYINQYCRTCNNGVGCCKDCKDAYHEGHDVLQIRRNTNIASIHNEDVDKYIDSKGIHKFSINGYSVYFIMKREVRRCYKNKDDYYCNASDCKWPLDKPNEFCSIYCKLKSINHPAIINEQATTTSHQLVNTAGVNTNIVIRENRNPNFGTSITSDSINNGAVSSSHQNDTSKTPLILRLKLPKSDKMKCTNDSRQRSVVMPPSQPINHKRKRTKSPKQPPRLPSQSQLPNTSKTINHKRKSTESPKQPSQSNLHSKTRIKYPKFVMPLSNTDIEADFLAFIGKKPPSRPKKRRNAIQNTLNDLCPGLFLDQITPDRYKAKKEDC